MLGDGGPITLPANAAVEIGRRRHDQRPRSATAAPMQAGRLKLVTPEAPLARGEDGLFRAAEGDLPADAGRARADGALEGSNVSPVETMVAMIAAARQFEQQMKMLQSAEQRDQAAATPAVAAIAAAPRRSGTDAPLSAATPLRGGATVQATSARTRTP